MAIARASVIRGPAKIARGAGVIFSQGDIELNVNRTTFDINTSAHGKVDERDLDAFVEASFTPEGRWDAATIAMLWPYAGTLAGTSLFGASDTPCVLTDNNSHVYTLIASALTRMPSIILSATKTMVGPATITGVRKDNSDWETADSLLTAATSGGTFADATFAPNLIKTQPYTGVWGGVPPTGFSSIQTEDGWTIDFDLQLQPVVLDREGTIDFTFASLGVIARCMPVGPSAPNIIAASLVQDAGSFRGRSLGSGALDLTITGDDGDVIVTIPSAGLKGFGFRFGTQVLRNGEIGFVATREFTAGVPQPLFTLAA